MRMSSLGSISTGTLRTADLLSAYADHLEHLVQRNADAWCSDEGRAQRDRYMKLIGDAREQMSGDDGETTHGAEETLAEMTEALEAFAPDYTYFGAHPGDGADIGYWVIEDVAQQVRDDGGLVVSDTSEIPADYRGFALHVNDHGNATLYACDVTGAHVEIWGIV